VNCNDQVDWLEFGKSQALAYKHFALLRFLGTVLARRWRAGGNMSKKANMNLQSTPDNGSAKEVLLAGSVL
jgi:hypothetical protein